MLARALGGEVPYAVKIHGSALEYTVKPHPRFLPVGAGGDRRRARRARRLAPHGGEPVGGGRRAGAGGADAARPARRGRRRASRRARPRPPPRAWRGWPRGSAAMAPAAASGSSFDRDPSEAAAALRALDPARDRIVAYVGKLIGSKGVELLLAAFPLVLARVPDARLLVVGFGAFRAGLEELADALARGDLAAARAVRGEHGQELPHLGGVPRRGRRGAPTPRWPRATAGRVHWAGRLEHEELTDVLPAAEAFAMPSTFPEAFGMVAAEAAACGVLPVVAGHSGMAEVARSLAEAVDPRSRRGSRSRSARARWRSSPTGSRAGSRRRRSCARARARRSSAWRASATRGTASRGP